LHTLGNNGDIQYLYNKTGAKNSHLSVKIYKNMLDRFFLKMKPL